MASGNPFLREHALVKGPGARRPYLYSSFPTAANRIDLFEKVARSAPDLGRPAAEAGRKLKEARPPRPASPSARRPTRWTRSYSILWCYGAKDVAEDGRRYINSRATENGHRVRQALYARMEPGVLS